MIPWALMGQEWELDFLHRNIQRQFLKKIFLSKPNWQQKTVNFVEDRLTFVQIMIPRGWLGAQWGFDLFIYEYIENNIYKTSFN